MLAIPATKKVE